MKLFITYKIIIKTGYNKPKLIFFNPHLFRKYLTELEIKNKRYLGGMKNRIFKINVVSKS